MKPNSCLFFSASALLLVPLLFSDSSQAAPGDFLFAAEFNSPSTTPPFDGFSDNGDKLEGFDGAGQEAVITNGDGLGVFAARISSGDPQLTTGALGAPIDYSLAEKVVARVRKSDGAGGWISPVTNLGAINADLALFGGPLGNRGAPTKLADETVAGDGWTLIEWDLSKFFGNTISSIRWDPFQGAIGDAFELDYFRIIEGETKVTVETDPGGIPSGFNLVKEWDDAANLTDPSQQLDALTSVNFGTVTIGPCSVDPSEDCLEGSTTAASNDAQVYTPSGLAVTLATDEQMIIEIGVIPNVGGTSVSELFLNDGFSNFDGRRRQAIPAFPADGALHVIRLTFENGTIVDELDRLRFDPLTAVSQMIEIDYIRVYTDGPLPPDLFWDSDTVTAEDQGGSGDWNTTNSFWYDTANGVNMMWPPVATGDDDANFDGTAGTVTIDGGGIVANDLSFLVDGYLIDGGDLTLDGSVSSPTILAETGVTATILSNVVADNDDVRKTGPGELVLQGTMDVNSFTGAGGTVTVDSGAVLTTLGTNPSENNHGLKLTSGTVLNIDGSVVATSGTFGGFSLDADFVVNVNADGNLSIGNAFVGWNAPAIYNFNDGVTNGSGFLLHRDGGNASINVAGGTHTFAGRVGTDNNGSGSTTTLTLSGGTMSAGSVGVNFGTTVGAPLGANTLEVNLDGGVLETDRVFLSRGPATSAGNNTLDLKLNGGTLRALAGGASGELIDGDLGNDTLGPVAFNVTVEENGVTFDTNGEDKVIDRGLGAGVVSGGSVTKSGAGNLYLNKFNSYDGGTFVTAGNLGAGSVGATVLGDVTVSSGAGLAYDVTDPGNPSTGLFINGDLIAPDPLVISIDSGDGAFVETVATNLIVADAANLIGTPTLVLDLSRFTGTGTWTAKVSGGQILLDYELATGTPFGDYMEGFFPGETDLLIVGPGADPDQDGSTNIEEFGYGGNPNSGADAGPRVSGVNDVSGTDYLTLTVAVRAGASFSGGVEAMTATRDGVVYTIEGSGDLGTFDSLVSEVTPAITAGLPVVPTGYVYKTFQLNPAVSFAGSGFLRTKAAEEVLP